MVKALDLRLRRSWVRLPTTRFQVTTLLQVQRRRNGGGNGGARPRNAETTGARVSFRPPPAIFSRVCCSLNFHSLSLCCLRTIKTSHSVGTTGRILRNKLTKQNKMANFYVCCDKQQQTRTQLMHRPTPPTLIKCSPPQCQNRSDASALAMPIPF